MFTDQDTQFMKTAIDCTGYAEMVLVREAARPAMVVEGPLLRKPACAVLHRFAAQAGIDRINRVR